MDAGLYEISVPAAWRSQQGVLPTRVCRRGSYSGRYGWHGISDLQELSTDVAGQEADYAGVAGGL